MMKIWDLPIRVYHWLQALLLVGLGVTGFELAGDFSRHTAMGMALTLLLVWRMLWGLMGSENTRFKQFLPSIRYARAYLKGQYQPAPGHNPLGSAMILLMLLSSSVQAVTGLILAGVVLETTGITDELTDRVALIHRLNGLFLILLSVIHVLAVVAYQLKGKHILLPMLSGQTAPKSDFVAPKLAPNSKALIVLAISTIFLATIVIL